MRGYDFPESLDMATDEGTRDWLRYLDGIGEPTFEVALPSVDELPGVLLDLAVPHEDVNPLLSLRPDPRATPRAWRLLERCVTSLAETMGDPRGTPPLRELPDAFGPLARYFQVYVSLAALPLVREYHAGLGIPASVTTATLRDLGRNLAVTRWRTGRGGLVVGNWLVRHFRGTIYDLGRLQFEWAPLDDGIAASMAERGAAIPPGDHPPMALSVHIPDFSGPLTPEACDRSFERAREFFPRYFPNRRYEVAVCYSWLLDDQLADYLPAESNIVRFQRRFHLGDTSGEHDTDIQTFVFGRVASAPDELPRETRLQRVIGDHLRAGRHWHCRAGWARI